MGDCRIRIEIARTLFRSLPEELTAHCDDDGSSARVAVNKSSISFVRMYSADTTVREIVDGNILLRNLFFPNNTMPLGSSEETEKTPEVTLDFTLWDCTFNPPKDITSWPRQDYPDLQGLKSKTLHSAGLFPSGTWMALPSGIIPNNFTDYDSNMYVDVQYNSSNKNFNDNDNTGAIERGRVEFKNSALRIGTSGSFKSGTPVPSQVMETVSNRFAAEEREEELKRIGMPESSIAALRRESKQRRAQKEFERATKLENRIAVLQEQSNTNKPNKKKKVSDQVLRMLVKSRATGDKNLKERDRLYFQCLLLVDDNNNSNNNDNDRNTTKATLGDATPSKEFKYFSPQDTFAKIANSVLNGQHKQNKELFHEVLFRWPIGQMEETKAASPLYYRFPVTMRVYEAKSRGYLSLSDNISNYFDDPLIVRLYKDREEATPLFQEGAISNMGNANDTSKIGISDKNVQMPSADTTTVSITTAALFDGKVNQESNDINTAMVFEDSQLSNVIREMEDANKKGMKKTSSTKKSSAAALKVRQMKMKSKAKGNKKLKVEDRVFLEVVSISADEGKPTRECYFLSRKEPIEKILWLIGAGMGASNSIDTNNWEFLVPQDDSGYRRIDTPSILMKDAEEKEILKSFDRLILRPKP